MHQYAKYDGFPGVDVSLGDLKAQRFRGDEYRKDQFTQAALTVEGKIWNFDLTYAGAYMDRPTESIAITPIMWRPTTPSISQLRRHR